MILIIGSSGPGKTNVLLNLLKHQQPDVDKFYLYFKNQFKSKFQVLINERGKIETLKNLKVFIDYSQTTDDVHENLEDYNLTKKKILIVFDDMIADMGGNEKLSPIVSELFLRGRKLNISIAFIPKSYFRSQKL